MKWWRFEGSLGTRFVRLRIQFVSEIYDFVKKVHKRFVEEKE